MSETLRTLEGTGLSVRYRARNGLSRRHRKPLGCLSGLFVLLMILFALLAYAAWTTRDTCPMERVIPSDQSYQVFANDVFGKRGKMADSMIWQVLPESVGVSDIPEQFNQDLHVPEWILNNMVPGACHVSGNDLTSGRDLLFVTKTSRVGRLLLKFRRFIPGVKRDWAGGLGLYSYADAGVYFAVRGRLLIVSRSRDALIRSLTLTSDEALEEGSIARTLSESGGEDLRGMISFAADDPLGDVLKDISFALRVDPREAQLKCRVVPRPEGAKPVWGLLADLTPRTLLAPPKGMLEISLNLNKSVRELWTALGYATGKADAFEQLWTQWSDPPSEGAPGLAQAVTSLLGPLGPGMRLTWYGADLNAMIPVPEIVATLDAAPDALLDAFETLPSLPPDADPDDMSLRYDPEAKCLYVPLIGGPSIEPTAAIYGESLLISSSYTVADALLRATPDVEELPQPGNLYVHVYPKPCIDTILSMAKMIAEYDFLKGYTVETIEAEAAPWVEAAGRVEDIIAHAAYEGGEVRVELKVVCAPAVSDVQ